MIRKDLCCFQLLLAILLGLTQTVWAGSQTGSKEDPPVIRYKFLVIDDQPLLESHNLRRKVNQTVKQKEPVLRLDAPWETDSDQLNYVCILYDEEEKIFKLWYTLMSWQGNSCRQPRAIGSSHPKQTKSAQYHSYGDRPFGWETSLFLVQTKPYYQTNGQSETDEHGTDYDTHRHIPLRQLFGRVERRDPV